MGPSSPAPSDAPPGTASTSSTATTYASGALETIPTDAANPYRGKYIPNTPLGASIISVCLSMVFTLGLLLFLRGPIVFGLQDDQWRFLGFFLACWAGFHWGEYAVCAGWNRARCSVDSFLLENGKEYNIANAVAVTEFVITMYFAPQVKSHTYVTYFGIVLTLASQYLRSAAMITAASNFSHQIVWRREEDHRLVTDGVYRYFRHPSYAGFFYWSLGTQLVLQNPISFIGYAVAVWKFFARRVPIEERYLIHFFGDEYKNYRRRVRTWIPFIP